MRVVERGDADVDGRVNGLGGWDSLSLDFVRLICWRPQLEKGLCIIVCGE